jgi:alpha-methylacyl-CoA racemase
MNHGKTEQKTGGLGPLTGVRVLEMAGVGPCPHAAMLLADFGADVARVDRPAKAMRQNEYRNPTLRGRRRLVADLKTKADLAEVLELVAHADVFLEGFRPGVAERLGIGPRECLERNPRLVYGRMTGWGQTGPLASRAGHDINYIAATGFLNATGRRDQRPVPPLNAVGDYGGGSMLLTLGVVAALFEAQRSGQGQIVDAAMVDGASLLVQMLWWMRGEGTWTDAREANLVDGGAPFYDIYTCQDERYVAVGAIEPQFYAELLQGLGLKPATLPDQLDRLSWPALKRQFAEIFLTKSRDEWVAVFDDLEACVSPVLAFNEVATYPQMSARETIVEVDGVLQAAPAPRFSRTQGPIPAWATHETSASDLLKQWSS